MVKKEEKKILLVSNNDTRRNNLSSFLRLQGYVVDTFTSGFQVMNLVENSKFDSHLIFVVENLEDMSGQELVGLIRVFQPNKKKLPLLFMSDDADPEEIIHLIKEIQVNMFIKLTDNMNLILEKVRSQIG